MNIAAIFSQLTKEDRNRVARYHADFDHLGNNVFIGTENVIEPVFRIAVVTYATLHPEKEVRWQFGTNQSYRVPPGCPWQELTSENI